MRFSPLSFALGLAAASLASLLSRAFRPLAVEITAAGMGVVEDARRILAEQVETVEDLIAEARSRREHLDAEALAVAVAATEPSENGAEAAGDAETVGRSRRRTNGARRRPS